MDEREMIGGGTGGNDGNACEIGHERRVVNR